MKLYLSFEEAADLSILLTYKELEKLKEEQIKGKTISKEDEKNALEASIELNVDLIRGNVSPEKAIELTQEWKTFFLKYPERYQQKIRTIQCIEDKAKFLLQQK